MLQSFAILLVFQLIGEAGTQLLNLAVPGPVAGMALLFTAIALRPGLGHALRSTTSGLLQHLSMLFVPAGVGVMLHAGRIRQEWVAIVLAVVIGTIVTLAVTALTIRALAERAPLGPVETEDE
ncbi:MAG: CidA/LrgA family protein [Burkholderiales bacterium]|nr:CidA/LrgA family protein [Burkholderiales bacterium]